MMGKLDPKLAWQQETDTHFVIVTYMKDLAMNVGSMTSKFTDDTKVCGVIDNVSRSF